MLWSLAAFLTLALAQSSPPEATESAELALAVPSTDDPTPWEDHWQAIIEGPPGCWEVTAKATWKWDLGRFGFDAGGAVFVGHLVDGQWRGIVTRSLGEDVRGREDSTRRIYPHGELHFVPVVGKRKPGLFGDDDEGSAVLSAMADLLGGESTIISARWGDDPAGVRLRRDLSIRSTGDQLRMNIFFPDGGLTPSFLYLNFPSSFSLPERRIVRVQNAKLKIRGHVEADQVFPEAEALSFEASALGFQFSGAQSIEYLSYRPCGGSATATTQPVVQ